MQIIGVIRAIEACEQEVSAGQWITWPVVNTR